MGVLIHFQPIILHKIDKASSLSNKKIIVITGGSDFGLYDGSDLKTYLLMRWWGPDALAVCQAHRGLPVGFLLLRYSVLFTVESLYLLYLLVIS